MFFVQCSSCGGVVGIVDYMDTFKTLMDLSELVKAAEDRISSRISRVEAFTAQRQ